MTRKSLLYISTALLASLWSCAALAGADKVVIGDIDDMSGLYADINGAGAVEAIKMAIADFGGSVLGQPIELVTADHQNKPDIGVQKFREWADRDGADHGAGRRQHRRQPCDGVAAKEKKVPFFAIGATGASLTTRTALRIPSIMPTTRPRSATEPRRQLSKRAARRGSSSPPITRSGRNCRTPPRASSPPMAERCSARYARRSPLLISPPMSCRRRIRALRCSASPTPAPTSPTR